MPRGKVCIAATAVLWGSAATSAVGLVYSPWHMLGWLVAVQVGGRCSCPLFRPLMRTACSTRAPCLRLPLTLSRYLTGVPVLCVVLLGGGLKRVRACVCWVCCVLLCARVFSPVLFGEVVVLPLSPRSCSQNGRVPPPTTSLPFRPPFVCGVWMRQVALEQCAHCTCHVGTPVAHFHGR